MRYLLIALGTVILHRALIHGLGMGAFAAGWSSSRSLMDFLLTFAAILDLPAIAIPWIQLQTATGKTNDQDISFLLAATIRPSIWSYLWSLTLGAAVAYLFYRRDRAKNKNRPPAYWKKGM